MRRATKISAAAAGLAVLAATGTAVAAANHSDNHWPYAQHSAASYTLAAVGDIACEPDDDENATTPTSLKCGSPTLGGMSAEFATAKQATDMHPDAVALLGDEQYQVGKLTDFEQSFEQAWGGLKMLERPAPGNHEYYPTPRRATTRPGRTVLATSAISTATTRPARRTPRARPATTPTTTRGGTPTTSATGTSSRSMLECDSDAFKHDCSTTDNGLLGRETQWLSQDLAANERPCTIAYWHQPTFSATTQPRRHGGRVRAGRRRHRGCSDRCVVETAIPAPRHAHPQRPRTRVRPAAPMDPAGQLRPEPRHPGVHRRLRRRGPRHPRRHAEQRTQQPQRGHRPGQAFGVMKLTLSPTATAGTTSPSCPAQASTPRHCSTKTPAAAPATKLDSVGDLGVSRCDSMVNGPGRRHTLGASGANAGSSPLRLQPEPLHVLRAQERGEAFDGSSRSVSTVIDQRRCWADRPRAQVEGHCRLAVRREWR